MKQNTLEYLESHQSETPSQWREEAEWRRDNHEWLRHLQRVAVKQLSYTKRKQQTKRTMDESE
ncbi:MAG: hypothetical protein K6A67_08540 [Bacteroidales bacterium]|nr:hypothetical protein [Bacteroidales bacterium]